MPPGLLSIQRQIESVRSACDLAEKVITEARKVYGLGTRQGPVALATLDKLNVARIAEQEKQLRVATNYGEGRLNELSNRLVLCARWSMDRFRPQDAASPALTYSSDVSLLDNLNVSLILIAIQ